MFPAIADKEYDKRCQTYLLRALPTDTCIFSDVMDVFGEGAEWTNALCNQPDYRAQKMLLFRNANVFSAGRCIRHGGQCPFGARLRVGGPPCTDHSTAGNRQGVVGPTAGAMMGYGVKAESTSTSLLCLENVLACPDWFKEEDTIAACCARHYFS